MKQNAEDKASALQTEVTKTYANRITGRQVRIETINAELAVGEKDNYVVQVSALELDSVAPHPINLVEQADFFFENYRAI